MIDGFAPSCIIKPIDISGLGEYGQEIFPGSGWLGFFEIQNHGFDFCRLPWIAAEGEFGWGGGSVGALSDRADDGAVEREFFKGGEVGLEFGWGGIVPAGGDESALSGAGLGGAGGRERGHGSEHKQEKWRRPIGHGAA